MADTKLNLNDIDYSGRESRTCRPKAQGPLIPRRAWGPVGLVAGGGAVLGAAKSGALPLALEWLAKVPDKLPELQRAAIGLLEVAGCILAVSLAAMTVVKLLKSGLFKDMAQFVADTVLAVVEFLDFAPEADKRTGIDLPQDALNDLLQDVFALGNDKKEGSKWK